MVDDVALFPFPLDAFDRSRRVGREPSVESIGPGGLKEAADLGDPAGVATIEPVVEEVDAHHCPSGRNQRRTRSRAIAGSRT